MKIFLFLTIVVLQSFALPSQPGAKLTLTQNGITYAKNVGVSLLNQLLANLAIPDQNGDNSGFSWSLTSIHISSISLPVSEATLQPGVGLTLDLSSVSAQIDFDWGYRQDSWPNVADSGSGDVSTDGSDVSAEISISEANGKPTANCASVSVTLNDFQVNVDNFIYQLIVNALNGQIKDAITQALENAIVQNINTGLNNVFAGLPLQIAINSQVDIDYELVSVPEFTANYMTLPDNGEFYYSANPTECPDIRNDIPDYVTSNMLQLILSDFVLNSAGYVWGPSNLNVMQVLLTESEVPSWSPIQLNTSDWIFVVPGLYKTFPNCLMEVNLVALQDPICNFSTNGALITVYGIVNVTVIDQTGTQQNAFALNGTVSLLGVGILSQTNIIANLSYVSVDFDVYETNVGPINATALDGLLNTIFAEGIVPLANSYLAKGLPLPVVPGLTLVNPSILYGENFVAVATDISYTPPSMKSNSNKVPIRM